MRLTLAVHPVSDIRPSGTTRLERETLHVDMEELRAYLMEDRRLQSVDIEIARPGEPRRIGIVYDVVEPRAKEPGTGSDFPGILGPFAVAGQGTTHVLRGAAVTVVDPLAAPTPVGGGRVLEMSGEAAAVSPYGSLCHVVVVPHVAADMPYHMTMNALRTASVKAAVYLAKAGIELAPASEEVFDLDGPNMPGREGLPRVAYIAQIHGHQRVAEVDEHILYGSNTVGMVPVPLHPNEWLDGAVVVSNWNMQVETYNYQNNPIVLDLYRRHQAGELTFVGTVATVAASEEEDRNRNCMLAAHLAKWTLGAEGVVLTKYGGGAPHADMGETARLCEALGMKTAVQVSDMSRDRRAESALLFNYPEINAIVYVGGNDVSWQVQPMELVIAPNPETAKALAGMTKIEASGLVGATSQQGASRIRASVY